MKRLLTLAVFLFTTLFFLSLNFRQVYAEDLVEETPTPTPTFIEEENQTFEETEEPLPTTVTPTPTFEAQPLLLPDSQIEEEEVEPTPTVTETPEEDNIQMLALETEALEGENEILNPSVETVNGTQPADWQSGSWGQNTASFVYEVQGQDGSRSLRVIVSNYTDGDAKWYPSDIAVVPGQTYRFQDYYKSTISTEVVLRYTVGLDAYEYVFLGLLPANQNWTTSQFTFTVPANATHLTVFHLIAGVGELWTDNFSLLKTENPPVEPPAPSENQILNPSVEEVNGVQPANWQSNSWGQNTAEFTHSTPGSTGEKSVHVKVTNYTDGDAKWYHDPVSVTAGDTYTFSDKYKSTANTEIVVQYTVGVDTYTYVFLGTVPASSEWANAQYSFVVPANATHATIFHLLAGIGELWTDDFSLVKTVVTPPSGDNMIVNPSVERVNGTQPANWQSNSWGQNTAEFGHTAPGNTGEKSVYVKVTSYTDGDAKWYPDPVVVVGGATYVFSDKYKSTANTEVVVQFTVGQDTYTYMFLGTLPQSSQWTDAQYSFVVPANATHATIFHLLAGIGELWTDDFSLVKTVITPPAGGNLISNPSVETASGTQPLKWYSNNWGVNTAVFEYVNDSQDGAKALKVTVSGWVSGDAKWYPESIIASDEAKYSISNYYKSTQITETYVEFEHEDGSYTYLLLGSNPASATWVKSQYTFQVPHGVLRFTIFHILSQNGELWTDNFTLTEILPVTSNVPNGLLEVEQGTTPESWSNNSWGNNDAEFEYFTDYGYNSLHSIKITVSNYVDGDAKWFHLPVILTPGVNYKVVDYYQSDTDSRVILAVNMSDGSIQYLELPTAPASAAWRQYIGTFTMPLGGVSVSIYHLLSTNGYLITDNYDILEYDPTPFNRALLTLTFDDGWEENITTAMPLLAQYGFKTNQFYATTFIENSELGEAEAISIVRAIEAAGHEMGSHSITHADLTKITPEQLQAELVDSKAYLQSILDGPIDYFATPYGAYNQAVKDAIMANYLVHRTVDAGFNSKDNLDITRLKVQNVLNTTTTEQIASWVEQAQIEKTWLILLYHRVANDAGTYDTTPALFSSHLAAIDASGIEVVTMSQALAELVPQTQSSIA